MSHFTVLVTKTNKVSLEEQLAPFDENKEVPRHHQKWDWYKVGGRWAGYFTLKENTMGLRGKNGLSDSYKSLDGVDIALVKDIDWEAMKAKELAEAEKNWAEYEAKVATGEKVNTYWEFGVKDDETKEQYIKRQSSIATFAVVHDGEWYEKGEMGWWGMVSDEKSPEDWQDKFDEIIKSLDPEDEVTLVDAHI